MSNRSRILTYMMDHPEKLELVNEGLDKPLNISEEMMYEYIFEQTDDIQLIIDRIKMERSLDKQGKVRQKRTSATKKVSRGTRRRKPLRESKTLHLKDSRTLVKSAEKLGYKVVEQEKTTSGDILLESGTGNRLTISHDSQEHLVVHATQGNQKVHELVRQHTIDRTIEHLQAKGMSITTEKLANGEMQIQAKERRATNGDFAEVKTTISTEGNVAIDVDKVKGKRCEQIVKDLAFSIGGAVSDTKKKDAYFQVVKQPTRINL